MLIMIINYGQQLESVLKFLSPNRKKLFFQNYFHVIHHVTFLVKKQDQLLCVDGTRIYSYLLISLMLSANNL
jgi:hypothetical protein